MLIACYKRFRFPKCGFLSCDANILCVQCIESIWVLHIASHDLGGQEEQIQTLMWKESGKSLLKEPFIWLSNSFFFNSFAREGTERVQAGEGQRKRENLKLALQCQHRSHEGLQLKKP